jgi:hypothetical protein
MGKCGCSYDNLSFGEMMCNRVDIEAEEPPNRISIGLPCSHVFAGNLCENTAGRNVHHSGFSRDKIHKHVLFARLTLLGMMAPWFSLVSIHCKLLKPRRTIHQELMQA